jgi:hypothetical protein
MSGARPRGSATSAAIRAQTPSFSVILRVKQNLRPSSNLDRKVVGLLQVCRAHRIRATASTRRSCPRRLPSEAPGHPFRTPDRIEDPAENHGTSIPLPTTSQARCIEESHRMRQAGTFARTPTALSRGGAGRRGTQLSISTKHQRKQDARAKVERSVPISETFARRKPRAQDSRKSSLHSLPIL